MTLQELDTALAQWQFRTNMKLRRKLYRKLASLISNGVRLRDAIAEMHVRQKESKGKKDPFAVGLGAWDLALRSSQSVPQATKGWIPEDERMLLGAGESNIHKALLSCIEIMDAKMSMNKMMMGLFKPFLGFLIVILIALVFSYVMIPTFLDIAPRGAQFTGLAGAVEGTSIFIRDWLVSIVIGLVGLFALIIWGLPRWTGTLRAKVDGIGPWAIYRTLQGVAWLIGLSALISNGEKLFDSIKKMSADASPWLKERTNVILTNLKETKEFGDALKDSPYVFPQKEILDDIGIFAKASGFDEALQVVAREWLTEAQESLSVKLAALNALSVIAIVLSTIFFGAGMFEMIVQMQAMMKQ